MPRTEIGLRNVDALRVQELEGSSNQSPGATTRPTRIATDLLRANSGLKVDFGRRMDASLINQARRELEDVPTVESYRPHRGAKVPFEAMEPTPICKAVVDSWVKVSRSAVSHGISVLTRCLQKNGENAKRIENHLGRTMENEDFWYGYAVVKMKNLPHHGRVAEGLAKSKDFAVVLIALETWNENNGFFLSDRELASGEDIIVNGGDQIMFSGRGGGLVIILFFTVMNGQE